MCRWGCTTVDTTYMCRWCGTRYCRECLRGDFPGHMAEETKCRQCNQVRCQGQRVEYIPRPDTGEDGKTKGKGRGRSASPSKRSAKTKRSASRKSGKKSAKKKKKKRK